MTRLKKSIFAALAVGICGVAASGETIRLRAQVAVSERQDVRLGDMATISGGNAQDNEELAEMVIVSSVQRSQKVKAESVLIAVMAQRGSARLGTLQISGAAECELSLAGHKAPAAAVAATPTLLSNTSLSVASIRANTSETPVPQPISPPAVQTSTAAAPATTAAAPSTAPGAPAAGEPPILRDAIKATLKKAIDLPEGEYKISIDSVSMQLDRPMEKGRVWMCRPMTKSILGTVQVESQLVEGSKVLERLVVSTLVTHRQTVVVVTKTLRAGDVVTADAVRTEVRDLDRKWPNLFTSMTEVVGLEAQRPMGINEMADQNNFKPALMAHKGDMVTVVCVSGAMQVQIEGKALDQAKKNDRIQIRNEKTGEAYSAVMIARGIGVAGAALTEEQEKQLVESLR